MPVRTRQGSGLTAASLMQGLKVTGVTYGVKEEDEAFTHTELDSNFRSMWPVGSVYINATNSRNPRDSSLIGFGVWKSFGKQTILVGKNAAHAHVEGVNQTTSGLSSKLQSVGIFADLPNNKCRLDLTTIAPHNFSKGQRVTLNGITGNTGTVEPNAEREIISVESNTKFSVDYRSPSGGENFALGNPADTLSVSGGASATLFGQRYDESKPAKAEVIPFAGTGGSNTAKLGVNEIPAHSHDVNWSLTNTINYSGLNGHDTNITSRVGDGNGFRDEQWGFVNENELGRYDGTALEDSARLTSRAYKPGEEFGRGYDSARESHSNLMPFVSAYFWVRIA